MTWAIWWLTIASLLSGILILLTALTDKSKTQYNPWRVLFTIVLNIAPGILTLVTLLY